MTEHPELTAILQRSADFYEALQGALANVDVDDYVHT
jgi:hypothetical protein